LPSPPEVEHDAVFSDEPLVGESYTSIGANLDFYSVGIYCANKFAEMHLSFEAYLKGVAMLMGEKYRVTLKRITIEGFPAWDLVPSEPGDHSLQRWIVVGSRIYALSYIGGGNLLTPSSSAKRFFSSFQLGRKASEPVPGCLSSEGRLPAATKGTIKVVVFPGYWQKRGVGKEDSVLMAEWYEIRSAPVDPEGEFLFRAMDYRNERRETQDDESYAANLFGVRWNGAVQTRKATDVEWKQAKLISTYPEHIFVADSRNSLEYQGQTYLKPSSYWGAVFVSPGKRWIAVYSYSGERTPATFLGGGVPGEGDVYWDVYDTASGEKVLSWSAKFVRNPALLGRSAVWIRDDYLVMPFDSALHSCVIGSLPALKH